MKFCTLCNLIFVVNTLISMTETIRKTIDNGNFGCGIFIDLKKRLLIQ